jgi:O-methyltransferase
LKRLWRALYWNALYPLHHALQVRRAAAGDAKKLRALKLVEPYTMVGLPRLLNAYELVERAEAKGLRGAIVECGVFKGGSAAMMTMASSPQRKVWLFDSFEGLPEPTVEDGQKAVDYSGHRVTGALEPIGQCVGPLDVVKELFFDKLKLAASRLEIRQGWFQETLPAAKHEIGPIAVLRLDGDWYDSTRVCLENLYDLVIAGGFVIIDDYGYWEGCRRAVDEFLAARKLDVQLHVVDDSGVWFEVGGKP